MEKSLKTNELMLGVCYYPEHWPEEIWDDDLIRMKAHGINVIRIAEFAWNKIEPNEGEYTYDFFDRFLRVANKYDMKVIFCTPSATPPAWLTYKYPEVLNAKRDGTLIRHGMRRHNTYNSTTYNRFVSIIVEKIVRQYASDPAIIGWQIDNELNCGIDTFYSESDHIAFRKYLKEKFGTLDVFNDAMGTVFWNQTYTSWDEIYLARTIAHDTGHNPHLMLEEKKFISRSTIYFCKMQADIIRKYAPKTQFITTNGIFGHLDSHEMTDASLDFITYDYYPNFAFDSDIYNTKAWKLNDRQLSQNLSKARSISKNFGIMEQQSGAGGWDIMFKQPMPRPGQMRLWTYQSVANGADFVMYFRWRTCGVGNEIYWHGLNDYSNLPNRRLGELKKIGEEFEKLNEITGSLYKAEIAFVKDYENDWDGEQDQLHGRLDAFSCNSWFIAAQLTHVPMDYIYLRNNSHTCIEELLKYKLLIYPHATILTKQTADLLKAYVECGGQLIMGVRTGYKDEYGRCPMRPMPGFASEICGVTVTDYTNLNPSEEMEHIDWDGDIIEAPIFNDILEPIQNADVIARFKGSYYDGSPALVRNQIGKGTSYYFGAGFGVEAAQLFLKKLGLAEPYRDVIELPEECELNIRSKDGVNYLFILNFLPQKLEFQLKLPMIDLLTDRLLAGNLEIGAFGVMILKYKV